MLKIEHLSQIQIDTGDSFPLCFVTSTRQGHFIISSPLPSMTPSLPPSPSQTSSVTPLTFTCPLPTTPPSQHAFQILLIPSSGVSFISDIDDTIKLSHMTSKRQMVRNMLLKDFEDVAGMSELYNTWREKHQGSSFHYVSTAPFQVGCLFSLLLQFTLAV